MTNAFSMKSSKGVPPLSSVSARAGCPCYFLFILFSSFLLLPTTLLKAAPNPQPGRDSDWDAAKETVVVFNPNFPGSEDLAKFYAEKRGIPADHLIGLKCSKDELIKRDEFETTLREPLLREFTKRKWWQMEKRDLTDPSGRVYGQASTVVRADVKVLVLMRGVPVGVELAANPPGLKPMEVDQASVDSELAALGSVQRPIKGPLENRYYQSSRRFPDCYAARGQLIVGRLDAADDETVKRMIEDSINAEREGLWGRAVLDFSLMEGGYEEGELWLTKSASLYRENGLPFYADRRKDVIADAWPLPDTILYFGWYTDHMRGALATPGFRFKPGAIACHLHSFSAGLLRTKTQHWVGPLLDHGAAAALGNVFEPYLTLTVHFDQLNARLQEGLTLGEAAWSATPAISWMNIVVGDPLYRPFPKLRLISRDDPRDAIYSTYRDLVKRYYAHDPKKFHREALRIAEEKHSGLLLELVGLLAAADSRFGMASDFLQHASALYEEGRDQLRCDLYEAEFIKRSGDPKTARDLVEKIINDPKLNHLPAMNAVLGLKGELK
jgi:uncharacterized protein (TIGR03790 family)